MDSIVWEEVGKGRERARPRLSKSQQRRVRLLTKRKEKSLRMRLGQKAVQTVQSTLIRTLTFIFWEYLLQVILGSGSIAGLKGLSVALPKTDNEILPIVDT